MPPASQGSSSAPLDDAAALSGHDSRQLAATARAAAGLRAEVSAGDLAGANSTASPIGRRSPRCARRRQRAPIWSPTGNSVVTISIRSSPTSSRACELMTLAEMLDVVEDKEGFGRLLATLDVPAFSIRNPTCVGEIRRREPLAVDDFEFLRRHTDRPIKVTLPGPYLLTRAMWVKEVSRRDLSHQGGSRRGRRRAAARGSRRAPRPPARLHPARRAGADRAGVHPGPDPNLHVRRARRAQGPGRGAGLRRLADQPRRRADRRVTDERSAIDRRSSRVPRQLEPGRVDAAHGLVSSAGAATSSRCTSISWCSSTRPRAPASSCPSTASRSASAS